MSIPVPFDLPARHLQRFWDHSGDFWQSQWDKFLDITGKLTHEYWCTTNEPEAMESIFLQAKIRLHYGWWDRRFLPCSFTGFSVPFTHSWI